MNLLANKPMLTDLAYSQAADAGRDVLNLGEHKHDGKRNVLVQICRGF